MSNRQLDVQIMGQSYILGCPEGGEQRLLSAVNKVDLAMCKIRDAGKIKARDRIAVLAALNLAFESPEPVQSTADAQATASDISPESQQRLLQLLKRLDHVLEQDGQLI